MATFYTKLPCRDRVCAIQDVQNGAKKLELLRERVLTRVPLRGIMKSITSSSARRGESPCGGVLVREVAMADIFDLFRKIEKKTPAVQGPVTHLVVGLGNPGAQYANTRHNMGFLAIDHIAAAANVRVDRTKYRALVGEAMLGDTHVLLMKPQTFMNLSGESVREAAAFYHIPPENVIVIYDDVTLPVGRMRVRGKGSDGGHNGIKSMIYQLKSDAFPRIRLGVGERPHPDFDLADWVLSPFTPKEMETLEKTFPVAREGLLLLLRGELSAAQAKCNGAVC